MSNKSSGTEFEQNFARILAAEGFWAHCLAGNRNGQPFDVIAARDGTAWAFDCKECRSGIFRLARIEENQRNAMELWAATGNTPGMFALEFRDAIFLVTLEALKKLEKCGTSVMTESAASETGVELTDWLKGNQLCR